MEPTTSSPVISEEKNYKFRFTYTTLLVVGIVTNVALFVRLTFKSATGSKQNLILFRCQSFLDALSCVFFLAHIHLEPPYGFSGWPLFDDYIICRFFIFGEAHWCSILWSILNMALISYERFIACCRPLEYHNFKSVKVYILIFACSCVAYIINIPWHLAVPLYNYDTNECQLAKFHNLSYSICATWETCDTLWRLVYFVWFLFSYFIPAVMMVTLYTKIIIRLKSSSSANDDQAKLVQRKITRIMLLCTSVFLLSNAFAAFIWLFDRVLRLFPVDLYTFDTSGVIRPTLTFCMMVNSCANPFVYFGDAIADKLWRKWKSRRSQVHPEAN